MQTLKDKIIEILVQDGHINKGQLEKALNIQREKGIPLRKVLVNEDMIQEETLLSLLSEELYMPTLNLSKYKFAPEIIGLVPERLAKLYNLIPISRFGNTITVAMADPLNIFALDDLRTMTGCSIDTVLSSDEDISRSIEAQYNLEAKDMEHILEDAFAQTLRKTSLAFCRAIRPIIAFVR